MPSEIRLLVYKYFFQSAHIEVEAILKLCTPYDNVKAILASDHVKECFKFILATTSSKHFRDEVKEVFLSQASFQLPGQDLYHSSFLQPGIRTIIVSDLHKFNTNTLVPFLCKDNKIQSLASSVSFTGLTNSM